MIFYIECILIYLLCGTVILRLLPNNIRTGFFTIINIIFTYIVFFQGSILLNHYLLYVLLISLFYIPVFYYEKGGSKSHLVAFLIPIVWMIFAKTFTWPIFIGVSYMAFRLSYLVFELQTQKVSKSPSLINYMGFAFFTPTFLFGPINPYENYQNSFLEKIKTPLSQAVLRIVYGALKVIVLSTLASSVGLFTLWTDGYFHSLTDLILASVFSYLYLYFNFSGYCDISIGLSALLGIKVKENFNFPLLSRNLKDFWNRWHITLSEYMRDIVFTPLSMYLTRKYPRLGVNNAVAAAIFITFVLLGLWHGFQWNYLLVGVLHGIGLVVCHYYTILLKRKFIPKELSSFLKNNVVVKYFATAITFLYVAFACIFFTNNAGPVFKSVKRAFTYEFELFNIIQNMFFIILAFWVGMIIYLLILNSTKKNHESSI